MDTIGTCRIPHPELPQGSKRCPENRSPKRGAVLEGSAIQNGLNPLALVMDSDMRVSEKDQWGCLSPAMSSGERRGEEMHQERQTGTFFPFSFQLPWFCYKNTPNWVFLAAVSACTEGDQPKLCHLAWNNATVQELPLAPGISICPEMKRVTRA